MLYYTIGQPAAFIWMLYGGLAAGLLYDAFRVARMLTVAGRVLTAALDATFVALAALLFGLLLLRANGGDMRVYALLGYGAGFVLYMLGVGWLLRRTCAGCARLMLRAFRSAASDKSGRKHTLVRRILK